MATFTVLEALDIWEYRALALSSEEIYQSLCPLVAYLLLTAKESAETFSLVKILFFSFFFETMQTYDQIF